LEVAQHRIVNRPSAMLSNFSKPFQSQAIRASGFAIPETLITNDPEAVRSFLTKHRKVKHGLKIIGRDADDDARILEIPDHPFFVTTLFVPQLNLRTDNTHLLINAFLKAATARARSLN
jgi:hypothetical protein